MTEFIPRVACDAPFCIQSTASVIPQCQQSAPTVLGPSADQSTLGLKRPAGADRGCLTRGSQVTDPKWPIVNAQFRRSEIYGCFHLRWRRGIPPATNETRNNEYYERKVTRAPSRT
jgi:hypothetical protein